MVAWEEVEGPPTAAEEKGFSVQFLVWVLPPPPPPYAYKTCLPSWGQRFSHGEKGWRILWKQVEKGGEERSNCFPAAAVIGLPTMQSREENQKHCVCLAGRIRYIVNSEMHYR